MLFPIWWWIWGIDANRFVSGVELFVWQHRDNCYVDKVSHQPKGSFVWQLFLEREKGLGICQTCACNGRQMDHLPFHCSFRDIKVLGVLRSTDYKPLCYTWRLTLLFSAFSVWLIVFQLLQSESKDELVEASGPDFSFDDLREDVLTFVPGVTASLGCFVLFGTTAPLRQRYASWFHSSVAKLGGTLPSWLRNFCCCARRRKIQRPRELQKGSAVAPATETPQALDDFNFDVEQGSRNSDYVVSSPLSSRISPLALSRSAERHGEYGSTVELCRFAAVPATLAEPQPLTSPSTRIVATPTNFSVPSRSPIALQLPSPMSSQQKPRWGEDRYYASPTTGWWILLGIIWYYSWSSIMTISWRQMLV